MTLKRPEKFLSCFWPNLLNCMMHLITLAKKGKIVTHLTALLSNKLLKATYKSASNFVCVCVHT